MVKIIKLFELYRRFIQLSICVLRHEDASFQQLQRGDFSRQASKAEAHNVEEGNSSEDELRMDFEENNNSNTSTPAPSRPASKLLYSTQHSAESNPAPVFGLSQQDNSASNASSECNPNSNVNSPSPRGYKKVCSNVLKLVILIEGIFNFYIQYLISDFVHVFLALFNCTGRCYFAVEWYTKEVQREAVAEVVYREGLQ